VREQHAEEMRQRAGARPAERRARRVGADPPDQLRERAGGDLRPTASAKSKVASCETGVKSVNGS
jgi:hypothetical protein